MQTINFISLAIAAISTFGFIYTKRQYSRSRPTLESLWDLLQKAIEENKWSNGLSQVSVKMDAHRDSNPTLTIHAYVDGKNHVYGKSMTECINKLKNYTEPSEIKDVII